MTYAELQDEVEIATGETPVVDYKGQFNPSSKGDWCELIKDIAAMANSGGGAIVFGLDDDGNPTGLDCTEILDCDPADITNKLFSYSGKQFADFRLTEINRAGFRLGCFLIGPAPIPLVFISPGNYQGADGKQKCAFTSGSVYFRHGAKSQPCVSDDLAAFLEREIAKVREAWIGRLRSVIEAPFDAEVKVIPNEGVRLDETAAHTIRLTDDLSAPAYRLADPNVTHPLRQKEVIQAVNAALVGDIQITSHHILCARRVHQIDANPIYCYHGNFASPTYSQTFVDWLVAQHAADDEFFVVCKKKYRESQVR